MVIVFYTLIELSIGIRAGSFILVHLYWFHYLSVILDPILRWTGLNL